MIEVVTGIATGIAFVVLLGVFLPSTNLMIYGLKTTYRAGEEIDFSMSVRDWDPCHRSSVAIRNEDTKEIIWVSPSPILSACHLLPHRMNVTLHPIDIGQSRMVINDTGNYEMAIGYKEETVLRNFTVTG